MREPLSPRFATLQLSRLRKVVVCTVVTFSVLLDADASYAQSLDFLLCCGGSSQDGNEKLKAACDACTTEECVCARSGFCCPAAPPSSKDAGAPSTPRDAGRPPPPPTAPRDAGGEGCDVTRIRTPSGLTRHSHVYAIIETTGCVASQVVYYNGKDNQIQDWDCRPVNIEVQVACCDHRAFTKTTRLAGCAPPSQPDAATPVSVKTAQPDTTGGGGPTPQLPNPGDFRCGIGQPRPVAPTGFAVGFALALAAARRLASRRSSSRPCSPPRRSP